MDKLQIAEILEEIGSLLEMQGENPFKTRAYHNASRIIGGLDQDLEQLVKDGTLKDLKGIGPSIAEKVSTLVATGKLPYYEELQKSLPSGLMEMIRVQGVGPKRAKILYDKLKIKNLRELEDACRKNLVAGLEGFGEKSQANILQGIGFYSEHAEYHHYNEAAALSGLILEHMRKAPGVEEICVCGSLRRHKEVVRDIDVLVSSRKPQPIMDRFLSFPFTGKILGQGETKSSILVRQGMQIDLRVVKPDEFPFAQHYFTGSKEHNIVMRHRAQQRGWKLSEYGLFKGPRRIPCADEAAIFDKLGLQYIPPELREDRGEFEAAGKKRLPKLIEENDLRGAFHVHTTWSDGKASLEDMVAEAERLGWEYVGISDHSKTPTYANGLSMERVRAQEEAIEKLRKKHKIRIFRGTECDILKDGSLDYPEEILKRFDFVVGSIHSSFKMTEDEMTRRIIRALETGYVTMLGHPTGRLLLQREGYPVNIPKIIDAAARTGSAIELNCHPYRFDLDWRMMPLAKEKGVRISINPDAHDIAGLSFLPFGIGIARKGWLTKKDVLNAMPLTEVEAWLKSRDRSGV
jgi:DNA polymerase (family 10)